MTQPSADTINRYWIDGSGQVWKHISYTDKPTATLELVGEPNKRTCGVVGSPILSGFRLLVPEGNRTVANQGLVPER